MRHLFLTLTLMAPIVFAPAVSIPAAAEQPSAEGLWEQIDEQTGQPWSWFRIYKKGEVYEGQIVRIFPQSGFDPNKELRCDKCAGADKGAPLLDMATIKGMKRNGLTYVDGTITDPRDGSVYRALMNLSADNKTLEIRGYLGIALFGRTQSWKRLADDALSTPPGRRGNQPSKSAPAATGTTASPHKSTAH